MLAVVGPQTLQLADGRLVHLAEILTHSNAEKSGVASATNATAYLRANALGRKVQVKFGGSTHDRYGAFVAHVFVVGDHPLWLQEGLVGAGLARVFPQPDNHACSQQLASVEEKARKENLGYWGLALFRVLPAHDTKSILNLVQTYQVVEGEVSHTTHAGGRMFIHFAGDSNRKSSFSAAIEPAARKVIEQNLDDWQGLHIRVRGWIERKKGPTITITQPEQLELLRHQPAKPATQKDRDE